MSRVDQRDAHTVGNMNRLGSELHDVPEKVDHPLGAGHDPGHTAEPRIQLGLVCFPLGGEGSDCAGVLRPSSASKSALVTDKLPFRRIPSSQSRSANVWARRSFPDGVLGIIPGSSTTTLRGRTSTSATTSWAT